MNSKLYIPKKVKVGFQKRDDCYAKKLAYIIYWDDKGVLRKEKSWEGWRGKKIDPVEFENKDSRNAPGFDPGYGCSIQSWVANFSKKIKK